MKKPTTKQKAATGIKIQTKLTKKRKKSKLDLDLNLNAKKNKKHSTSYKWRTQDKEMISDLVAKVNEVSGRKIDATKVLRGAIFSASKKSPQKFINDIIEAEIRSFSKD